MITRNETDIHGFSCEKQIDLFGYSFSQQRVKMLLFQLTVCEKEKQRETERGRGVE